ncbi:hypothetical protein PISMIDRAFT_686948 [Pisolithus microcarpus 441]|uniref:Uncharacterized protein n=1 Tax=Pisolithus microcarpus 441 TaxID=765257 RepID=A0A0C9Z7E4_9AGAM|nr:hypothetical protein PISMIDRAFT_686948 [Pisolithus microcarpus 441]
MRDGLCFVIVFPSYHHKGTPFTLHENRDCPLSVALYVLCSNPYLPRQIWPQT